MDVHRTYIVKASEGATAVAICDALGYPEKGMFVARVVDSNGDDIIDDGRPAKTALAYVASGFVAANSPLHGAADELLAEVKRRNPAAKITLAQCKQFVAALEATDEDARVRVKLVRDELLQKTEAVAWAAEVVYDKSAVVSSGGKTYRSLIDENATAPGGAGWRELWAAPKAAEVKAK